MCKNANDFFNFYNILKFMVLLKKLEIVCFSSLYLKKNKIKNKNKTPWVFSIIVEVGGGAFHLIRIFLWYDTWENFRPNLGLSIEDNEKIEGFLESLKSDTWKISGIFKAWKTWKEVDSGSCWLCKDCF